METKKPEAADHPDTGDLQQHLIIVQFVSITTSSASSAAPSSQIIYSEILAAPITRFLVIVDPPCDRGGR